MKPLRQSRVVKDMNKLLAEGWLQDYSKWDVNQPLPQTEKRLWEADRGARWLLSKFGD